MTDLSSSSHTHPVPSLDSTAPTLAGTAPLPTTLPNGVTEDEEDYTIKCICGYQEDDGSTIFCESCETWQHIECYYASQGLETPGENDNHYCRDCEPRSLDSKSATERQRIKREGLDFVDPKLKKPVITNTTSTKGQRKKKASEQATNGSASDKHDANYRNGTNGNSRDGTSNGKRPKASHRSSNSTHVLPLKMPAPTSRRSTSASHTLQSPTKTSPKTSPPIDGEPYSNEFMHLYDNDPGETNLDSNTFCDLKTADSLSEWSHDPEAVKKATNGRTHQEIFLRCEQSVDEMDKATIEKNTKSDPTRKFHNRHPKWTYITVSSETPEGMIVGELRGKIGHKQNYFKDEANRWEDLRHPAPFVFFHPSLPIYIDTREEGTMCRYVRRSCQPNLKLITILQENSANNSELRFCLSAMRPISPGEEVTLAWTPDTKVRECTFKSEGISADETAYVQDFYRNVLSNFGGCACEDPDGCGCFKWHRAHSTLVNGKSKKSKKTTRTNGRTPSSRSGSEAVRYKEEDDDDDDRSTTASSRSKPHSRDTSPPDQASAPPATEREKRKIDAIEARFAQQEQPLPQKKKQRKGKTGGGNTASGSPPASASQLTFPNRPDLKIAARESYSASVPTTPAASKPRYADAGTSRKGAGSPQVQSPTIQSLASKSVNSSPSRTKPTYVDTATQVDMDQEDAKSQPTSPSYAKRPVISLTKRLLRRCHKERVELDKKREQSVGNSTPPSQSPTVPSSTSPTNPIASQSLDADGDVDMDYTKPLPSVTESEVEPSKEDPKPPENGIASPTTIAPIQSLKLKVEPSDMPAPILPIPLEEKAKDEKPIVNGAKSTPFHVDLPSPPLFDKNIPTAIVTTTQPPTIQTPTSLAGTPLLPTASSMVQPSPIKKKLSLGDYMSRRTSTLKSDATGVTPTTPSTADKEQSPSTASAPDILAKPLESLAEEAKEQGAENGSAIIETPKGEDVDPMAVDTTGP